MSFPSSSHPPLTPPSPPYSPFSHLPFELVEDIIGATLPLYHDSDTYVERQKTLLPLCLVSRLFHQISKPLLFAILQLANHTDCSKLFKNEEEEVDRSSHIRELIVCCDMNLGDLRPIFRTQLNITKLVLIASSGVIDLSTLSQMSHLSILHLAYVTITASSPFSLRHLSELSLACVDPTECWTSNFDFSSLPSLRAVSILAFPHTSRQVTLAQRILEVLSNQVDVIAFNIGVVTQLSPDFFARIKHKTLGEFTYGNLKLFTHASCVRALARGQASAGIFAKLIQKVEELPATPSLELLYLPLYLSVENGEECLYRSSIQSLLDKCSVKNIEVVFEEQVNDWHAFQQISPDFRRRMKAKKLQE